MAKHRRPIVIHAAPARTSSPPAAPAKPEADAKPSVAAQALNVLTELAVIVAAVVGFVAIAAWIDGVRNPPLPMGWDCWTRERTTSTGPERYRYCEASPGWHVENSSTAGGRIVVPDDARPVRRHYVSD